MAESLGVSLEEFIKTRVEAAIHRNDALLVERTYYAVRAIAAHHGLNSSTGEQLPLADPQQ